MRFKLDYDGFSSIFIDQQQRLPPKKKTAIVSNEGGIPVASKQH